MSLGATALNFWRPQGAKGITIWLRNKDDDILKCLTKPGYSPIGGT